MTVTVETIRHIQIEDVPEYEQDYENALLGAVRDQQRMNETYRLYNADPDCNHDIQLLWSGYKCRKCMGWYCA